jgi:hypothetical protein
MITSTNWAAVLVAHASVAGCGTGAAAGMAAALSAAGSAPADASADDEATGAGATGAGTVARLAADALGPEAGADVDVQPATSRVSANPTVIAAARTPAAVMGPIMPCA